MKRKVQHHLIYPVWHQLVYGIKILTRLFVSGQFIYRIPSLINHSLSHSSGLSVRSHVDILNDFIVTGINVTLSTNVVVDYTSDVDYADTPIKVCMQMSVQPSKI